MLYLGRYLCLMLFLCIHVAGCGRGVVKLVDVPAPDVTASKPESREVSEFLEYIGRTASPEFVEIRPRVSGYLMKIHFKEGSEVKAEEPLFEIDRRPYEDRKSVV